MSTQFHTPRERDAWATIRGYVYQVELTIARWLDIQPGEQLELECGEDIDLVSEIVNAHGEEQERILEQVKHLESVAVTLRSTQVLSALANFHMHRAANPSISLRLRLTTNARRGKERNSSFSSSVYGLDVWEAICQGTLQELPLSIALTGIRSLLLTGHIPDQIPDATWQSFQDFVREASDEELNRFIQACEWSTRTTEALDLQPTLQQRLRKEYHIVDDQQARELYARLFLFVFRLLSQRGRKVLAVEERKRQMTMPTLSASDHATLELLRDVHHKLEERVSELEHRIEQTIKNEINNQGAINQSISNSSIVQNFYDIHEQFWNTQISLIKNLHFEIFKLGDVAAATFPYVIDPFEEIYSTATQILQDANDHAKKSKRGLLLLGEANAGKTRLALEAIKQTLPEWYLLRWQPYYTNKYIPTIQILKDKSLVLFLDDLHEYVSIQPLNLKTVLAGNNLYSCIAPSLENPRITALRTLIEIVLQVPQNIVIVATCRSEYLESINAELGDHLLIRLKSLRLPSFNSNPEDSQAKQIIATFQQKEQIHLEDWDGTIGSLVLGLSRKKDQYAALPEHAQIILKAVKLLAQAAIFFYPEQHIRKVCIGIFPKAQSLQEDGLWQESIDLLLQKQFIIDFSQMNDEPNIAIRSASYFEKVIFNYPPPYRQNHLERDLFKLLEILTDLEDIDALLSLAFSFIMQLRYEEALNVLDRSLTLNDNDTTTWINKGLCLNQIERAEEALQAYERAIEFDKKNVPAMINRGFCLEILGRFEDALYNFEHIISLHPKDAYSWARKGFCLTRLRQWDKALEALDQALFLDANNEDAWYTKSFQLAAFACSSKSVCYSAIGLYDKALEAVDQSLLLDSNNADVWVIKGSCLALQKRYSEAIKSYEQALVLNPGETSIWFDKGICLKELKRYKEAIEAFKTYLAFDSQNISAWDFVGTSLIHVGLPMDALQAFDKALDLDPSNSEIWRHKGKCLSDELSNYKEAFEAYEQAFNLDSNNIAALVGKGICLMKFGNIKEALEIYDQALTIDSTNIYAINNKGVCLFQLGQYKEALACFERVLFLDSTYNQAWINKSKCLQILGHHTVAVKASQKAQLLDPAYLFIGDENFKPKREKDYQTPNKHSTKNNKKHLRKMQQKSRNINRRKL